MIEQAHQQHPELSVERLCELFSVSRSWYYERSVWFYPLCASCVGKVETVGGPLPSDDHLFVV